MTRLKNTIVSTFAAGFFLIWTGVTYLHRWHVGSSGKGE